MMKELLILVCIISAVSTFESISLRKCMQVKACFKTSKSCNIDQCQFVVTWRSVKYKGNAYLEIEMVGDVYRDGGYIGISFSEDKNMGDNGIIACSGLIGSSKIGVLAGYNNPSSNKNILFTESEVDPNFIVKEYLNKYGGSFNPNTKRISCRFLRLITPQLNKNKLKDLSQGNGYYLVITRGESSDLHSLKKHTVGTTVISDVKIDFSSGSFNTITGSSAINSSVAKAHGVIMIIVWICCCSISIILARYYKEVWVNKSTLEGRWFNTHRGLQGSAFILLVIALILIFIHVGGYSKLEDMPMSVHPILGIICSILFLINPFIALCRCDPRYKKRPIFNWIHFIVGTLAYILSIPTIMIGFRLPAAGLVLSQLNSVQWIVFFFVIFQFCIEIILEIHGCLTYRKNKGKLQRYKAEMREYEMATNKGFAPSNFPQRPPQSGRTFKLIILGIFISVALIVTLVLSIIVIVN